MKILIYDHFLGLNLNGCYVNSVDYTCRIKKSLFSLFFHRFGHNAGL